MSAKQQAKALEKIKSLYGTEEGEFGPTLFVSHHLEELEKSTLLDIFGVDKPDAAQILNALVLVDSWSSDDDGKIDTFDFSLPGNVTDYLLSVRFDDDGEIDEVSLES